MSKWVSNTKSINPEKRRTTVGPWKNVAEFREVFELLFGASADHKTWQRALDHMQIWELRRSTMCPAAVLATGVIVKIQLKDANAQSEQVTDDDLKTMFASAFTRFFNYMSSIMQVHNMRTMYDTANRLGLQSFVVDLRHICAHGQTLPPLQVLRNTARYCLFWLRDYYWTSQCGSMCDVDARDIRRNDRTQFDDNVTNLFGIYDSALECYLKGAKDIKIAKRHLHGKRFVELKQYYETHKVKSIRHIFDVIARELSSLIRRDHSIKDQMEIYIEALFKMNYFFTVAKYANTEETLKMLIDATQNLFRMLAVFGFIEEVFLGMLAMVEHTAADSIRRAGASFWAQKIAEGFVAFRQCKQLYKDEADNNEILDEGDLKSSHLNPISKKMRQFLKQCGVDVKRTLIFGDSLRNPWIWVFDRDFFEQRLQVLNEFTVPIIKLLVPLIQPMLNQEEMNTLELLIDAYHEQENYGERPAKRAKIDATDVIHTPKDLLKILNQNESENLSVDTSSSGDEQIENTNKNVKRYGAWTVLSKEESHTWAECPLGRLPWE